MDYVVSYFKNFTVEDLYSIMSMLAIVIFGVLSIKNKASLIIAKYNEGKKEQENEELKLELINREELEDQRTMLMEQVGEMLMAVVQASKMTNEDKQRIMSSWIQAKEQIDKYHKDYKVFIKNLRETAKKHLKRAYEMGENFYNETREDVQETAQNIIKPVGSFLSKYDEDDSDEEDTTGTA